MRLLLLLPAVLAAVTASSSNSNCIVGCTCQDIPYGIYLRIVSCERSLALTNATFAETSKKITRIVFEKVGITNIAKDTFNGFDSLENVIFQDSSIGSIDKSAFNLPFLGTLSFTRTTFREIPELISDYLEELIFDDCELNKIPNLDKLESLKHVNLANNRIEKIDVNAFAKLDSLEELTLSNNSIQFFPPNLLENNEQLNSLILDHNPLQAFKLSTPTYLEILSLKSCKLSLFDRSTSQNLDLVSDLHLSNNQISNLPLDAFQGMKELKRIDLSSNQLIELDDEIFVDNSNLNRIILDNNNFATLPRFQTNNTFQTYYFACNNCTLKSLDNNPFENMGAIVTLSLTNNQINNIEGVFNKISGLKELYLSNNLITSVGVNTFSKNISLETLDLSNNPLSSLDPVVFVNIGGLKKLNVSNTGLTQLWANHNAVIPSLEHLLIGKNRFSKITVQDLSVTPNVILLDLNDNPLECTEELKGSIAWLIKNKVYPVEGATKLKTHEALRLPTDAESYDDFDPDDFWKLLAYEYCPQMLEWFDVTTNVNEKVSTIRYKTDDKKEDEAYSEDYYDEDIDDDEYESEDDEGDDKDDPIIDEYYDNMVNRPPHIDASVLKDERTLLSTYSILQLTTVFVLTAIVVSFLAIALTLCVLRRNRAFNVHNGNLPRFKIPLWQHQLGQKKHSGSVYKPLSEDLSGPRTPIINRYEFKQQPSVHNSIP